VGEPVWLTLLAVTETFAGIGLGFYIGWRYRGRRDRLRSPGRQSR